MTTPLTAPPSTTPAPVRPSTDPLSRPLLGLAGLPVAAGLVSGGIAYAGREPAHTHYSPATSAWPTHIALSVAAAVWLAAATWWWRRRGSSVGAAFTAPLRQHAGRRLLASLRSPARLVPVVLLTALLVYSGWRFGEQVLAGLDPNFRVDAWGGPTYLGAMYCHYLDGGLIAAAALLLLDRLMPGRAAGARASQDAGAPTASSRRRV